MQITIIGLGPGKLEQLTLEAWRVLEEAGEVYLRTEHHPLVAQLPRQTTYQSFDALYESAADFDQLYTAIVAQIIELGQRPQGVFYAVPGHPFVAERTTQGIVQQAQLLGIPVRIVEGLSFIEPCLTALGIDGIEGLQLYDALEISTLFHPPLNPDRPALIGQVYSRQVASEVKLTLMNQYADEYEVVLLHGAGTDAVQLEHLPLYEIDRSEHISYLTSLYMPPMHQLASFEELLNVMARLRAPNGCPWDQAQTLETLRPYLLEEVYEVLEAVDAGDYAGLAEELGDLLMQVVFHTQIAVDEGEFYITDVLEKIIAKMIRRHPHIWGTVEVETPSEVVKNWEAIKREEQAQKQAQGLVSRESVLDGIPSGLPALVRASRLQEKAASVGFDWAEIAPVIDKIREEIDEIASAPDDVERGKEFGDLLFAIVNWTRWLHLDPESLLRETNARFYQRFAYIEAQAIQQGRTIAQLSTDEMEVFWEQAKSEGL